MGINTRMKKREPIRSDVQLIISDSTAKTIKLTVGRDPKDNSAVINGQLVDISALGCCVESPLLLPTGVELDVKIDATAISKEAGQAHPDPIIAYSKTTACVMKSAGCYRIGISFKNLPEQDKAVIDAFIKSREGR